LCLSAAGQSSIIGDDVQGDDARDDGDGDDGPDDKTLP
jgi:hypothetical protein